MITVGFLGCAHVHAATYRDELATLSGKARVVAVYDHDTERSREFAAGTSMTVHRSAEDLVQDVDAVVVASEHVHYAALIGVAAAAGKPILCEKPLGVSMESADAILASGAWLSMALPVRYAPAVRQARDLCAGGALGHLVAMSGVNHAPFPGGFFGTRSLSGGGALIDHVVHLADALHWITGVEYASVYAETGDRLHVGDVEDVAQVVATTTSGAWASIDASWSRPAGMAGGNDFLMQMWFENGRVAIDAFARHLTVVRPGGRVEHVAYDTGINTALVEDWVRAVTAGAPPPIPAVDGWRATRLALAAQESARVGAVVHLTAHERSS